jgi:hypothetical protein
MIKSSWIHPIQPSAAVGEHSEALSRRWTSALPLVWLIGLAASLGLALASPSSSTAQARPSMSLDPAQQRLAPGESFSIDILAENLEDLAAFQFTISFPPSDLEYRGIDLGPFLGATGRSVTTLPPLVEAGKVTYAAISANDGPGSSGSGLLARIHLSSLGSEGQFRIGLDQALVTDATNSNRQTLAGRGATVTIEETGFRIFSPFAIQRITRDQIPEPLYLRLPSSTPRPPASATPVPSLTPVPSITPTPQPTSPPQKDPEIGELQCYGREEWVTIKNGTAAEVDLNGWSIRSTQGGETYWIEQSLTLAPGEELFIYSGPGAPDAESRLKKIWDRFQRWNDAGDAAQLYSPRPERLLLEEIACPTPTPRAREGG